MASFKPVWVAPSSCWYPASLCLAPLSAPTHQTWKAPSWGSWRRTVCVFYSELLHQSGAMSIQPPPLLCQQWTGLIFFGSSSPFSFPGLFHISFKQVLLEDSNLEQSNIVQGSILYSGCVETDENARFGIILYPIGTYSGHILDTLETFVIFQVHSKYILGIPGAFCLNSWTLEPYSAAIPRVFWLHSYSIRGTFQLDFRHYSGSNRTAVVWRSKSILNIMTAF